MVRNPWKKKALGTWDREPHRIGRYPRTSSLSWMCSSGIPDQTLHHPSSFFHTRATVTSFRGPGYLCSCFLVGREEMRGIFHHFQGCSVGDTLFLSRLGSHHCPCVQVIVIVVNFSLLHI
jgi:hypothetical protein